MLGSPIFGNALMTLKDPPTGAHTAHMRAHTSEGLRRQEEQGGTLASDRIPVTWA